MKNSRLTLLSALSLIVASILPAQETPAPGDRVRITSKNQRFDGRLVSISSDTVFVEVQRLRTIRYRDVLAADTIAMPRSALDRIDVSRGSGTRALRGALIGGTIAALVGYVEGSGYNRCNDCTPTHSPEVQGLIGAGFFGAGGAVIGALVGWGIRWDRWQEVPSIRGGMLLRPLPQGAVGVGLTLRF